MLRLVLPLLFLAVFAYHFSSSRRGAPATRQRFINTPSYFARSGSF
jgi:hypothetical protein